MFDSTRIGFQCFRGAQMDCSPRHVWRQATDRSRALGPAIYIYIHLFHRAVKCQAGLKTERNKDAVTRNNLGLENERSKEATTLSY